MDNNMNIGEKRCPDCGYVGSTSISDKCWCDREPIVKPEQDVINTTIKNNLIIAKFMGFKNSLDVEEFQYCRWYHPDDLGKMFYPEDFKYDSSWSELMKVIKEIQSLYETQETYGTLIDISTDVVRIRCKGFDYIKDEFDSDIPWEPFKIDFV